MYFVYDSVMYIALVKMTVKFIIQTGTFLRVKGVSELFKDNS